MSSDMKFDYKDALKRQNISECDIMDLRMRIKDLKHVPISISDKKVCDFLFCLHFLN